MNERAIIRIARSRVESVVGHCGDRRKKVHRTLVVGGSWGLSGLRGGLLEAGARGWLGRRCGPCAGGGAWWDGCVGFWFWGCTEKRIGVHCQEGTSVVHRHQSIECWPRRIRDSVQPCPRLDSFAWLTCAFVGCVKAVRYPRLSLILIIIPATSDPLFNIIARVGRVPVTHSSTVYKPPPPQLSTISFTPYFARSYVKLFLNARYSCVGSG
ncbi:hypothetical protein BDV95DRAFT_296806 [Massariosphaeria phaeospora]|uniref:Uncharacterized protein n=1 Tax=Massariosphaeria phaeospora TaxID=100035 RepID=A0A7C8ME30_9PLEO|nr:hypothetical protein BDV95DRAFT_296806 [Massariosphaeria phaeospora]